MNRSAKRWKGVVVPALGVILGAPAAWAQDVAPESSPSLQWEAYAVRWGQIVTEGGVDRPGLNTIYDTLRVSSDAQGDPVLDRHMVWRDLEGAWRSFRTVTSSDLRPRRTVTRTDQGNLHAAEWSADGTVRRFGYDGSSGSSRFVAARGPIAQPGFATGLYGMEFRTVETAASGGRVLMDRGSADGALWLPYAAAVHEELPNLVGLSGPFRVFRTGQPGALRTEYWLADEPPYVAQVRFEPPNGPVTRWVITRFERLDG